MQVGDPLSVPKHQNISLLAKAGGFSPLQHLPLVQDLHGIHLFGGYHLNHTDFSKGTTADDFEYIKIITA